MLLQTYLYSMYGSNGDNICGLIGRLTSERTPVLQLLFPDRKARPFFTERMDLSLLDGLSCRVVCKQNPSTFYVNHFV